MTTLIASLFFVWVELIGFDNTKPDFGVGEYLDRMPAKPQMVSLLLHNEGLFLSHEAGLPADFTFPSSVAAYRARPFNRQRRRQEWTAFQLKGLVAELKRRDVEVFASFFAGEQYPVEQPRAEEVAGKLATFLADYGFSGLHGSDGYAPPSFLLPECADADRPRIARERAAKYAANWQTFVAALKPKGMKVWINTCWTRDPFEALYRYGVDYRLLAKTGIDGFIVECSAAAQSALGWNYQESTPVDRATAMVMRLKASVPEMPLALLHAIDDGAEQWSTFRHAPMLMSSEALALGSVFYGEKRALDGVLACLGDGLSKDEWAKFGKVWKLAFAPAKGPVGARVVWSDRAFDAEFDACTVSHDASSNTLLGELIRHGTPLNAIVSVEQALSDKDMPIVILNPKFFPADELAALRARTGYVCEVGRGARGSDDSEYVLIPKDTPPFPGMPKERSCYWKRPIPENLPPDAVFKRAQSVLLWLAFPFTAETPELRVFGYRMANGRMAILGRNESDAYMDAAIGFGGMCGTTNVISDVLVHTEYPAMPIRTTLRGRIAPHDTIFISVGSHECPLPSSPLE